MMVTKKNWEYWTSRRNALLKALEEDERDLSKRLRSFLETEAAALDNQIASYYGKYGTNNVIEYRNLMNNLSKVDRDMLMQRMNDFAEKYPEYAHLMPIRESIYQLNRAEGLQQSIYMSQLEFGAMTQKEFEAHLKKYATLGYEVMPGFNKINDAVMNTIVNVVWTTGGKFSQRIWKNRTALAEHLYNDFTSGIIRDDNYQTMARNIRKTFTDVSLKDSMRLIYTEGSFVLNESAIRSFDGIGYTNYICETANDGKVCNIYAPLQGLKFPIKARLPGKNFPLMHPWCRCVFTVAIDTGNLGSGSGSRNDSKTTPLGSLWGSLDSNMGKWENEIKDLGIEHAYTVDKNNHVYHTIGTKTGVSPAGINFNGATILHNHPKDKYGESWSFSSDDFDFIKKNPGIREMRLVAGDYRYGLKVKKTLNVTFNEAYKKGMTIATTDKHHEAMEWLKREGYIDYIREKL